MRVYHQTHMIMLVNCIFIIHALSVRTCVRKRERVQAMACFFPCCQCGLYNPQSPSSGDESWRSGTSGALGSISSPASDQHAELRDPIQRRVEDMQLRLDHLRVRSRRLAANRFTGVAKRHKRIEAYLRNLKRFIFVNFFL